MITVVRRASDGLLADIQDSPNFPADAAKRVQNALAQFGGLAEDWTVFEVPAELWTVNPAARQFATLAGGVVSAVTQSTPPAAETDKASIAADGVEMATITASVNDTEYAGLVKWVVRKPDGTTVTESEHMVAGAATLELTTTYLGDHVVMAETVQHGVAGVMVTGV